MRKSIGGWRINQETFLGTEVIKQINRMEERMRKGRKSGVTGGD